MKKQATKEQQQLAAQQINLREKFINLPIHQRDAAVNYFNAYNLAAWLYNDVLDQDAKDYVEASINFAREAQVLEQAVDVEKIEDVQRKVNEINGE